MSAACGAAFSQASVQLEFDAPGQRRAWIADALPTGPPESMASFNGKSAKIPVKAATPKSMVFVHDVEANLIAAIPLAKAAPKWKPGKADYKLIGEVSVRAEHQGRPIESATITVNDGRRAQTQVIDSWAHGEAQFFAVAPGNLNVSVLYRSEGKTPKPWVVAFETPLVRTKPELKLVVSIPDPVATVDPSRRGPGGSPVVEQPASPKSAGSRGLDFGTLASLAVGVGAAGSLVALFLYYARRNPDALKGKLKSLGVDVPEPVTPDPGALPVAAAPLPPQQIILDDAAPAQTPAAGFAVASRPRLVRENGEVYEIAEGATWVGREAGLPISLPNEQTLSRQHAQIEREGGRVVLRDLQSTNGTFVNGSKVADDVELRPGDSVQFGAVRFRFEV